MRLLSHNPAMLRAMEYLALCVLPIPVLMFYSSITKNPKNKAVIAAEKELRKRTSGQVLFVHFDVNFLKKVNDEYGHAEGDRHLKATAKVLSDSFAEFGKVYRLGGDLTEHYQQGISKLEQAQTEYNETQSPPVPLQIAHGMAEYDCSQRDPEIAERLADSRMYEHKRSMKQPVNA